MKAWTVALLADAVDAAEALLQAGRVPGQVVVDHQPAELEVDALAGGFGRDADLLRGAELLLGALALVRIHAAVDLGRCVAPLFRDAGASVFSVSRCSVKMSSLPRPSLSSLNSARVPDIP